MAQWNGMYSGHTHETLVQDVEQALRHAIDAFRLATSEQERHGKAKSVRNLAKRLLSARRRLLKAKIVAAQRVRSAEAMEARAREIASLQDHHAESLQQGIADILSEFGAPDALGAG